jgi:hypothetical protein
LRQAGSCSLSRHARDRIGLEDANPQIPTANMRGGQDGMAYDRRLADA